MMKGIYRKPRGHAVKLPKWLAEHARKIGKEAKEKANTNTALTVNPLHVTTNELMDVRRPCIRVLKQMINYRQLDKYPSLYWACPPDLGHIKDKTVLGRLKADGYAAGVFDLTIVVANKSEMRVFLIEFKTTTGGFTHEQKAVIKSFAETPVTCMWIRHPGEFIDFLKKELTRKGL